MLADANSRGEEQLQDDIVADGAEVAIAPSGRLIACRSKNLDLFLRRGEQGTYFARGEHRRNAILDGTLDLQHTRRRLGDDPLFFEVAAEDFQRRNFAAD